jgi:TfoX/Sxy family transcriptional regulator of competence genes
VAFDEQIAERMRVLLRGEDGVTEKRMFGGLAFLVNGNMAVAASGQGGLLVRVEPAETQSLIAEPHADRFVMRGTAMDGWLRVDGAGVKTQSDLQRWVRRGVKYARTLPPK